MGTLELKQFCALTSKRKICGNLEIADLNLSAGA